MPTLLRRLAPAVTPLLDADDRALEACRRSFLAAARSLSLVPAIIPQPLRDDIAVLHGFCRRLDDAIDDSGAPGLAAEVLDDVEAAFLGPGPAGGLVGLVRERLPRLGIEPTLFRYLFEALRRDLDPAPIADDEAFLQYSYGVAGVVSVMMCSALGVNRLRARPHAVDLGLALQVTNVVRDWPADARRGRVYLPASRLASAGLTPEDLLAGGPGVRRRLTPVLRDFLRLGDEYYRSAEEAAGDVPLRYRHGVLLMGRIYRREGWRAVLGRRSKPGRVLVPWWERGVALAQVAGLALTPRVCGLVEPRPHRRELHRSLPGRPGTGAAPRLTLLR